MRTYMKRSHMNYNQYTDKTVIKSHHRKHKSIISIEAGLVVNLE